ncbi:hypothetical protein [Yersinia enterocolitica]|nr:hypothetical protein [Yersinia enterocolitica]
MLVSIKSNLISLDTQSALQWLSIYELAGMGTPSPAGSWPNV